MNESGYQRLLIVDDEENMRHMLTNLMSRSGYRVETAKDGQEALDILKDHCFDFILCDLKMPRMDGLAFLHAASADGFGGATVIMMSAFGTMDTALEAIKAGAYDYISKPFKPEEIRLVLKKAEEREILRNENQQLKERIRRIEEQYTFGNMVAQSESMRAVFQLAEKVGGYDTTVLVTGESGTGKELVARGIHFSGHRGDGPLIPVNCGGIPDTLLESELFGHRKGAFTGADRDKPGLFRKASGGTLFLDEIGELPIGLQVKLLRVLQDSEVRPVGGTRAEPVDVRIIAATATDLESAVASGSFREDLFYRLNVMRIAIPPLRDRSEDLPLLCAYFLRRHAEKLNRAPMQLTSEAMACLLSHRWPGNVRELENALERAIIMTDGDTIEAAHLPPELATPIHRQDPVFDYQGDSLKAARRHLEKEMITRVLIKTGGNRTQAAKLLEISHPSLLSKIKIYKIDG